MSGRRGRPSYDDILTRAEWQAAEAVRHGLSNPQMAERIGTSSDAVKFHVANILSKLGMTNRAELRRWNGVRKRSVLSSKEPMMNTVTKIGPIGQLARTVKDIAAAQAWYSEILGLPHLYSFGNLAFFDCDGTRLLLSEGDGVTNESIIYFRVNDIHASCANLSERGVTFTHAPHLIHTHEDSTEEWMAFFTDNEGRPLAIMTQCRVEPLS